MITIYRSHGGVTACTDQLDPAWLAPGSGVWVWVDLSAPTPEETRILSDVFHFHELAVEDALSELGGASRADVGHGVQFRITGPDAAASHGKLDIPVINLVTLYGRSEQGWHFLVGNKASIRVGDFLLGQQFGDCGIVHGCSPGISQGL